MNAMMTDWANGWLPLMAGLSVKVGILLGVVGLACWLMRGRSAALRHAVWSSGLAVALLLPLGVAFLPGWAPDWEIGAKAIEPVAAADPLVPTVVLPAEFGFPESGLADEAGSLLAAGGEAEVEKPGIGLAGWLMVVWLVGVGVVSGRWLMGCAGLLWTGWRHRGGDGEHFRKVVGVCAAELGLEERVRVIVGREGRMPLAWGLWRRTLMLPGDAREWSEERLRAVVLHELGHLVRRDPATEVVVKLAMAVYWFHPLVWLGIWRAGMEREQACDDLVVGCGIPGAAYARHLLEVVTGRRPGGVFVPPAVAMSGGTKLEKRVGAVLADDVDRRPVSARLVSGVVTGCVCVALPLAVVRAQDESGGEENGKDVPGFVEGATFSESGAGGTGGGGGDAGSGGLFEERVGGEDAGGGATGAGDGFASMEEGRAGGEVEAKMVEQLRRLVELRQAQLQMAQESHKAGSISTTDLRSTRRALLAAEERLARSSGEMKAVRDVRRRMIEQAQLELKEMEEMLEVGKVERDELMEARARLVEAEIALEQGRLDESRRLVQASRTPEDELFRLKVDAETLSASGLGEKHPGRQALERRIAAMEGVMVEEQMNKLAMELVQRKNELEELSTKYADRHPFLMRQKEAIALLEREMSLSKTRDASALGAGGRLAPGVAREQAKLEQLMQTFTESHPQVIKQRSKIEALEKAAAAKRGMNSGEDGTGRRPQGNVVRSYAFKYVEAKEAGERMSRAIDAVSAKAELSVDARSNQVVVSAPAEIHEILERMVRVLDRRQANAGGAGF